MNEKETSKKFDAKSSDNIRKSSVTPRSSPSNQTDDFYLPRDGTVSLLHHNQHLASDFLLKSISATPTLAYYFPKILQSKISNNQINEIYFNNSTNNVNRVKLLDHATTSGLVGKGLLFDHFDSTGLDDLELNDENFNDEFISNFNNSNLIRNNKLFYDSLTSNSISNSDFALDKLLLDDFRKRLSQINEESSGRSSLISRTKWSSSLSQLSNNESNTNNNNNQVINNTITSPITNINKNKNNNSTSKIINKTSNDVFGRPIHRQLNRTYTKLI